MYWFGDVGSSKWDIASKISCISSLIWPCIEKETLMRQVWP